MIPIDDNLAIPDEEVTFATSRSGGPGGQNVNKLETRVTAALRPRRLGRALGGAEGPPARAAGDADHPGRRPPGHLAAAPDAGREPGGGRRALRRAAAGEPPRGDAAPEDPPLPRGQGAPPGRRSAARASASGSGRNPRRNEERYRMRRPDPSAMETDRFFSQADREAIQAAVRGGGGADVRRDRPLRRRAERRLRRTPSGRARPWGRSSGRWRRSRSTAGATIWGVPPSSGSRCRRSLGGAVGYLLALLPPVRRWLAGEATLDARARRRAAVAFLDQEVFRTRHRTGILLFVSLFERRVVLLADSGIHQKVEEGAWEAITRRLARGIRERPAGSRADRGDPRLRRAAGEARRRAPGRRRGRALRTSSAWRGSEMVRRISLIVPSLLLLPLAWAAAKDVPRSDRARRRHREPDPAGSAAADRGAARAVREADRRSGRRPHRRQPGRRGDRGLREQGGARLGAGAEGEGQRRHPAGLQERPQDADRGRLRPGAGADRPADQHHPEPGDHPPLQAGGLRRRHRGRGGRHPEHHPGKGGAAGARRRSRRGAEASQSWPGVLVFGLFALGPFILNAIRSGSWIVYIVVLPILFFLGSLGGVTVGLIAAGVWLVALPDPADGPAEDPVLRRFPGSRRLVDGRPGGFGGGGGGELGRRGWRRRLLGRWRQLRRRRIVEQLVMLPRVSSPRRVRLLHSHEALTGRVTHQADLAGYLPLPTAPPSNSALPW